MDRKSSRFETHTAVLNKKKKRSCAHKEDTQKQAHEHFPVDSLASDQPQVTKRKKKKKKGFQHLTSSLVKNSETFDEAEKATSHKKKKKRRDSGDDVWGVDEHTSVVHVIVNKENIENLPKNFRKNVDVVYVDTRLEQKSAKAARAEVLPVVTESCAQDSQELHNIIRDKKSKRSRKQVTFWKAAQESQHESIAPSQLHTRKPSPSVEAEDKVTESPVSAGKHKSKKRKKKVSRNKELEAIPESLDDTDPGKDGTGEDCEVPNKVTGSNVKKKSKKRKRASVRIATSDDEVSVLDNEAENMLSHSPQDHGTLVEEVSQRPKEAKTQDCSGKKPEEERQRSEPTNEEGSNLESAGDSAGRYLSEDGQDSDESDVDLGSAVRQLQEFIPDIKERAPTTIKRMYRDDLRRFQEFKAQGVAIRFGKFSAKENKQIEKNVQEFLSLTGIENADKLLYTDRYPEEKSLITNLKRKHAFRIHIGKGIARPWKLVYYRAKKIFDVNNYKGRYSKEDTKKLKTYQSLHGNDWKKIGALVARSSLSVALKFSQMGSQINHGAWSKIETQKLIKAVEEVILKKMSPQELKDLDSKLQEHPENRQSIVREKLYKGISWVEVEAKVETRNWMQCKSKWTEILTKRMTHGGFVYRGITALQAKISLIERLYELNVEDANEIDWEDLASAIGTLVSFVLSQWSLPSEEEKLLKPEVRIALFGDVPPSYVQTKFYKLKAACVPFWQKKTFPEIIDYLYETSLPLLKEKLNKKMEKQGTQVQTPSAPKQDFLFKDIFRCDDSEGEDIEEQS